MALQLPDLAPKTYRDLYNEALAALPTYTRTWTDFNDSDPGITIVQLLCYVEETLLYRLDRIPPQLQLSFVRLAAGAAKSEVQAALERERQNAVQIMLSGRPCFVVRDLARIVLLLYLVALEWSEGRRVAGAKLQVLEAMKPYRLVTEEDYQRAVALMTRSLIDASGAPVDCPWLAIPRTIARGTCGVAHVELVSAIDVSVPVEVFDAPPDDSQREVLSANRFLRQRQGTDTVSWTRYIADKAAVTREQLYHTLCGIARSYLEPRRLLGTPLRVERPSYTPVDVALEVVVAQGADLAALLSAIPAQVCAYLDPATGGAGKGPTWGEVPSPLALSRTLGGIPGVRHVQSARLHYGAYASFQLGAGDDAPRVGRSTRLRLERPRFVGLPWLQRVSVRLIDELSPDNTNCVELTCNDETI